MFFGIDVFAHGFIVNQRSGTGFTWTTAIYACECLSNTYKRSLSQSIHDPLGVAALISVIRPPADLALSTAPLGCFMALMWCVELAGEHLAGEHGG
jgi:hypothetical protein